MPSAMLAVFYFISPQLISLGDISFKNRLMILGFIFTYTFLLPIGIIAFMYNRKWISTLTLKTLNDRRLPYIITAAFYLFLSYFLAVKSIIFIPTSLLLLLTATVIIIVAIISNWWQISAHSAALGGALGAFVLFYHNYSDPNLFYAFLIALILSGIVMSARLNQNVHTLGQVVAGWLIGVGVGIFGGYFLGL